MSDIKPSSWGYSCKRTDMASVLWTNGFVFFFFLEENHVEQLMARMMSIIPETSKTKKT